jgi:hypothetical protein
LQKLRKIPFVGHVGGSLEEVWDILGNFLVFEKFSKFNIFFFVNLKNNF